MGVNTNTVGGGRATQTGDAFQSFLQSQLGMDQGAQNRAWQNSRPISGVARGMNNEIDRQQSNFAQPGQQTSAFGTAFQNAMSGRVNDQSGAGAATAGYIAGGPQSGPQYTNQYTSQNFQGFDPSQLATNFGQGQTGMADLSRYGNIQNTNVDVMRGFGDRGMSGYDGQINGMMQQGQNLMQNGSGFQGVGAQDVQLDPAKQIDLNSPEIQAQQQIADRQRMIANADMNARFGAEGAGALGTGAQYASGTLNAESGPRMAALLQQNIAQQQQMDLQQRQAKAGVSLQTAGNMLQAGMSNQNAGLQSNAQRNSLFNSMLSGGLQGRGQDFQNQATNRGFDINQMGMNLNQAQGNQQSMLGQQGQMLNANIANQGMGNQFAQNAFAQNSQNQQLNNQNGMNMAQQQNQFNLNNAGNTAQFGQAANGLNQNSWAQGQNNFLQALGLGNNINTLGNSNQQNMLNQLFGAFGQATGIGTSQAQITQTPTVGSQILQGGLGLGGMAMSGGMFGGGGMMNAMAPQAQTQMPNLPPMPQFGGWNPTTQQSGGYGNYQPTIPWNR